MRFILCIDDEPIRYRDLKNILSWNHNVMLVHSCRFEDVNEYLNHSPDQCIGVCLDHDMPPIFHDGKKIDHGVGVYFAQHFLCERSIPVIVVSSNPDGARKIRENLDDYGTPNIAIPAGSHGFADRIVIFLQTSGNL